MYKSLILALAALSSVTLAAPTDASTAVDASKTLTQLECWSIPEWERREKKECHEINREERHEQREVDRECRDRRAWERPQWCINFGYRVHDKRAEAVAATAAMTAEQCWRLPEWERRERRECHELNREERHDERRVERECRDRRSWDRPQWCRAYGYRVRDY